MTSTSWELLDKWKNKLQGQVWRVRNERGTKGFFKFAYPKQWYDAGPIIGNEWIAKQLADYLHYPCANVELAELDDGNERLHGIVSLPKEGVQLHSWCHAPEEVHAYPEQYVRHFHRLLDVIAFDVWLTNIDRGSGKNIILYRENNKYNWYLIDHAYCAYGCDRKWRPGDWTHLYWRQVWQFYHIPKGWLQFIQPERLLAAAEEIAAIPDSRIEQLLAHNPDPLYSALMRKEMATMLISRKRQLRVILINWLLYSGIKESHI